MLSKEEIEAIHKLLDTVAIACPRNSSIKLEEPGKCFTLFERIESLIEAYKFHVEDADELAKDLSYNDEEIRKQRDRANYAEKKLKALHYQIEFEGCEASHYGETTYECNIRNECNLCKLREEKDFWKRKAQETNER